MAMQYTEAVIEEGPDLDRHAALSTLADGKPWVFLVASNDGDGWHLSMDVGGGITDAATIRRLLKKAVNAIPARESVASRVVGGIGWPLRRLLRKRSTR